MALSLDAEAQGALDLAKRCVPEDRELGPRDLLCALYHGTAVKDRLPALADRVPEPHPLTADPGSRLVSDGLWKTLGRFGDAPTPGTAADLFAALADSPEGRELLLGFGVSSGDIDGIPGALGARALPPEAGWRSSPDRPKVIEALGEYGRMLTAIDLRPANLFGIDETIREIEQGLIQRKQHSVVLVGPPGVGKTVVVQEFARRIATGDPSILPRLRDCDVFELSPAFLKAGASIVGQFEERIKGLLQILTEHPKVIVFVDEVHSLLQSEMHLQGPWSGASAEFKKAVGNGSISLIGCTTLAEFRHYIEPDRALADRFTQVRIDPPSVEQTEQILRNRMPGLRAFYPEVEIPDEIVPIVVGLAEDHLLGRYQPRKSIRLLDQACAWCLVQEPPVATVDELAVRSALETETGQKLVDSRTLTKPDVVDLLRASIVGQDALIDELADAVLQGMRPLTPQTTGTRGNFFFAGPTGVGKTETAKVLAAIVGGSSRALVRIDCNTLQGSGWDSQSAINTLLGSPPGFIGYVRGQGGVLSQIRDTPDCVVLFDEIEKADPGVAKLLLQILAEGLVDDVDGNPLDFRRAFLVFTSNAGVTYGGRRFPIGFGPPGTPVSANASVSPETVMDDLRSRGFPQEFLGRNFHWFVFRSLDDDHGREILRRLLDGFARSLGDRRPPIELEWDPGVVEQLVTAWPREFGARALYDLLRTRVMGRLAVAEAADELDGVTRIRLRARTVDEGPPGTEAGTTVFGRDDGVATLDLYSEHIAAKADVGAVRGEHEQGGTP